jgi:hypothetical protein
MSDGKSQGEPPGSFHLNGAFYRSLQHHPSIEEALIDGVAASYKMHPVIRQLAEPTDQAE